MVDFDAASARFAKEQASRRKQTVAKKEQDAKELARTRRLQAKWEADAAERRAAAAAQQAVEDALRERDLERNHGVSFARRLRPYLRSLCANYSTPDCELVYADQMPGILRSAMEVLDLDRRPPRHCSAAAPDLDRRPPRHCSAAAQPLPMPLHARCR